jgi:hypothetical protein
VSLFGGKFHHFRANCWSKQWQHCEGNSISSPFVDTVTLGASPNDWRKLIALGSNASSGLSGTRHTYKGGGAGYAYGFTLAASSANKCIRGTASGDMAFTATSWPSSPGGSANSDADAIARKRLLERYLNARKSWRGGNFLAEFAETVHMLRHPIESLFSSTSHFTRRVGGIKHLPPKAYAGALGNLWLAWSFGWKPLFDDIRDANQAIQKLASGTGHDTMPLSASASASSSGLSDLTSLNCGSVNNYTGLWREQGRSHSTVKYYGAMRARPESFATVADTFGISPGDIIPAVWEAIPWSFFIDYFLNVQEVIDSWQYASTDFAWMNQGIKNRKSNLTYGAFSTANTIPVASRPWVSIGGGGSDKSTEFVSRAPIGSFPAPSFRFRIPGLSSLKWVNTSALIAQILASRPR